VNQVTIDDIARRVDGRAIKLIRAIYCGPDGITRGKSFPPAFLAATLEGGIGLTRAQASVTVFDQLPAESRFMPVGEVRIVPDINTFQLLPYLPGHARMLSDLHAQDGTPWELCPRSLLKRLVANLADRGLRIRASFENEFMIYVSHDGRWEPLDAHNCFSSAAMDFASAYILPMIDALHDQEIVVEQYYPEAGAGQQELPVRHQAGVAAADQQVVFRETVRGVALAHGFRVSFMPKPDPSTAGNGCHIHFSLWDVEGTQNLFHNGAAEFCLSALGRQFTAGLLAHLPGLLALTAPTTNSYRRFVPRCWSSSTACWGPDNREATVRVASGFRGRETATLNLEYKPADPSCNPYLALAGLIAAGLDGIDRRLDPGPALLTDPALLSPDDRRARGLADYPKDLATAVAALETDELFLRELGESRIRDYATMKRAEIAGVEALGERGELAAYQFRF
jgi:glutamine synthetase